MTHFTAIFAEMRRATRDWTPALPRGQQLKKLALHSSPLFLATAAAGGALIARRTREPPETDFLASRVSFTYVQVERLLSQRELSEVGCKFEPLRRAAQRMRGPVERDLASAECLLDCDAGTSSSERAARALGLELPLLGNTMDVRRLLCKKLVEIWSASGYFSEPAEYQKPKPSKWKERDPTTGEDQSYGRDVGCEVPLCMLSGSQGTTSDFRCLAPSQWGPAADALEQHGVVMLSRFISKSQVAALRHRLHIYTSALDSRSQQKMSKEDVESGPVREYDTDPLQNADPELEFVVSTRGRKHFCLRGRLLEDTVRDVQAGALPLVWEHLVSTSHPGALPIKKPYVSEVQLLVTDPCAIDQFWHIDNASRGLSLFVPLTPVTEDIGPILLMPGSHRLFEQDRNLWHRLQNCSSSLLSSDGVVVSTMDAGDALLHDSRIIHRGAANRIYNRTCVALVFRYDFDRPPGYGATGTLLVSWGGKALAAFMALYAKLPGKPRDSNA